MPIPMIDEAHPEVLRRQFHAWIDGARSRARGLPLTDMPWQTRSAEGDAWENGWEVVDMELECAEKLKPLSNA
jgi:hypothetical protein